MPGVEVEVDGMDPELFLSPEILVGLVDPIRTGRIEDVEVNGIFERLSLVRHVGRNAERFAGVDHDHFSVDPELERSFQDVGQLLVGVAVLRHDAAFFQQHARQHDFLPYYELTLQQRRQILKQNAAPRNVLQDGWLPRAPGDGVFQPRFSPGSRTRP